MITDLYKLCNKGHARKAWKVMVASALWSVWLVRNDHVFGSKKLDKNSIFSILKIRTFKWLEAGELICQEYKNAWQVAPLGCILASIHDMKKAF